MRTGVPLPPPDTRLPADEEGEEVLEGVAGVRSAYGQLWGVVKLPAVRRLAALLLLLRLGMLPAESAAPLKLLERGVSKEALAGMASPALLPAPAALWHRLRWAVKLDRATAVPLKLPERSVSKAALAGMVGHHPPARVCPGLAASQCRLHPARPCLAGKCWEQRHAPRQELVSCLSPSTSQAMMCCAVAAGTPMAG